MKRRYKIFLLIFLTILVSYQIATCQEETIDAKFRFAIIGDYGDASEEELAVAKLIKSWSPDFIITVGDNNYDDGGFLTIDKNIGQFFHTFIGNYAGRFGQGSAENRFFPTLGNHDWNTVGANPYLEYFTLPGNERYYDFIWEDVHFFAIDSDDHEPHGTSLNSRQGKWFQEQIASSTARFKVVYFHHPPYTSGNHGSTPRMRWGFKDLGADVVIAGHDHHYERLVVDGLNFIVTGNGGKSIRGFGRKRPESVSRYNKNFGASLATVTDDFVRFEHYSIAKGSKLIDRVDIPIKENTETLESDQEEKSIKEQFNSAVNDLNTTQLSFRHSSKRAIVRTKKLGLALNNLRLILERDEATCSKDITKKLRQIESIINSLEKRICTPTTKNQNKCISVNILNSVTPKLINALDKLKSISNTDNNNNDILDICE